METQDLPVAVREVGEAAPHNNIFDTIMAA